MISLEDYRKLPENKTPRAYIHNSMDGVLFWPPYRNTPHSAYRNAPRSAYRVAPESVWKEVFRAVTEAGGLSFERGFQE